MTCDCVGTLSSSSLRVIACWVCSVMFLELCSFTVICSIEIYWSTSTTLIVIDSKSVYSLSSSSLTICSI